MTELANEPSINQKGNKGTILNVVLAGPTTESESEKQCSNFTCTLYDGCQDAIGYSWLAIGRGTMIMSNIFLLSSLLFLASDAAGCSSEDDEACSKRIYGFYPSSLISNIGIISGLLSAFLMPVCGAMVDFTPHRRLMGIILVILLTVIQGVQVGTVAATWFAMLILQGIAGFFYQLQVVAVYAYLPEIAREVGEPKMAIFCRNFTCSQFAAQFLFLVVVVVIQISGETGVVLTAQISQGINTTACILFFTLGWIKYMTTRPAAHVLPEGHNLLLEGFRQNWRTAKNTQRFFKKGLRWYFLALIFAESAAAALTSLSVVYLNDTLRVDETSVGIFFLVVLLMSLPGTQIGLWVTRRSNPNTSWKLSMVYLFLSLLIGALVLEMVPAYCTFIWGAFVGTGLGWFYSTENLFFSMILPKGQEAEFSGFFVYCTQILSWFPNVIFTVLIENNVSQKYGLILVTSLFLVAVGILMFAAPWDEIVEEATSGSLAMKEAAGVNIGTSAAKDVDNKESM